MITIDDAKDRKASAESAIAEIMRIYEKNTGLKITALHYDYGTPEGTTETVCLPRLGIEL